MVFNEKDCDRMERALNRAYFLFMNSGRLSAANLSIAKAVLSRAIMHRMSEGEGEADEFKLASFAVNSFDDFRTEVVERDMLNVLGTPEMYQALSR
jgi:hypothetical protein